MITGQWNNMLQSGNICAGEKCNEEARWHTEIVSSGSSLKSLCSLRGLPNALLTSSTTYNFEFADDLKGQDDQII